jgi:hypothetical protein
MTTKPTLSDLSDYDRDERDTKKQVSGLQAAYEEMKRKGTLPKPYRRKKAAVAVANDNVES